MKKRTFHTTPAEIQSQNSDTLISVVKESVNRADQNTYRIIEAIKSDTKQEEILGFTGVVHALHQTTEVLQEVKQGVDQGKLIQKLEEVKSALLANNITLKKVEKKEISFPDQKEVDFSKTNALLDELIKEVKKPCTITLKLK